MVGDLSPEQLAALEEDANDPESGIAAQQAKAEAGNVDGGGKPPLNPGSLNQAELLERGIELATTLTSPGGPWHGLPPEAATDPSSPDWAENQRWAIVTAGANGSWLVVTSDGEPADSQHAANVLGYAQASDEGRANLATHAEGLPRMVAATEAGNGVAWGTLDENFWVAPGPWQN